jgi:transposase InsO family protein
MEGFWGILKSEMYYLSSFEDYKTLESAIEEYIRFYNYERRQRNLNLMAPMTVRQLLEKTG